MTNSVEKKKIRCAIYTRKSTSEGLDNDFTTLDAQRESGLNYFASQKSEGWVALPEQYNDGGFTGANIERPALTKLLEDIKIKKIDCVVVYKVDRLSRSLIDFTKMLELFEKNNVTFVSVTQHFNTNNSMGRLTLNILLSFAQFEREIISERTRDKMSAARKKGKWLGGWAILGYDLDKSSRTLKINEKEAKLIRELFSLYIKEHSPLVVANIINEKGYRTKKRETKSGRAYGGNKFKRTDILFVLNNIIYAGKVRYAGQVYEGVHEPIISEELYNKAQEIMANNRHRKPGTKNVESMGLLGGLLRCKHCSKSLIPTYTTKNNRKYRYYVCIGAQKRGYKDCPTRSVNAQEIEEAVINCLKQIAGSTPEQEKRVAEIKAQIKADLFSIEKEQKAIDANIASMGKKIKATKEATPSKNSAKELATCEEELKGHEQRLSLLHVRKAELHEQMITKEELQKAMIITSPVWETLFYQEKKRIIDFLVKEIDYDGPSDALGITINANGIKLLCTELDQVNG
ncbi:MAG: recombinase family protein [Candidatus Margulisiibacteriota bacterium]